MSKRLASIVLDVPIEFNAEALRVEDPDVDALRKLYIDLNFNMFARELPPDPNAPAEAPAPTQAKQTQLVQATLEKSRAKRAASLAGQGDMFAAMEAMGAEQNAATPAVELEEQSADELQQSLFEGDGIYATAATTPHTYHIVRTADELHELVDHLSKFEEICFDTETTGLNTEDGDRVIEIGCVEIIDGKQTDNCFHFYLNPLSYYYNYHNIYNFLSLEKIMYDQKY